MSLAIKSREIHREFDVFCCGTRITSIAIDGTDKQGTQYVTNGGTFRGRCRTLFLRNAHHSVISYFSSHEQLAPIVSDVVGKDFCCKPVRDGNHGGFSISSFNLRERSSSRYRGA